LNAVFRDDQGMTRSAREYVEKSVPVFTLSHAMGRDVTSDD